MSQLGRGTDFIIKLMSKCKIDEQEIFRMQEYLANGGNIDSTDNAGSI